jgi:hypothetical protein
MEIADAERTIATSTTQAGGGTGYMQEISDTLKLIQAEDNIVQCPHTGNCLYTKSLVIDHGKP